MHIVTIAKRPFTVINGKDFAVYRWFEPERPRWFHAERLHAERHAEQPRPAPARVG